MMPDTPLPEVAAFLPTGAAVVLSEATPAVQVFVLERVRGLVVYWEQQGCTLDPMAYEAVMDSIVVSIIPLAHEVQHQEAVIAGLKEALDEADKIIKSLQGGRKR